MSTYTISIPFSLIIQVEADSEEELTEDVIFDAIIDEHGKYPHFDARHGGIDDYDILDVED